MQHSDNYLALSTCMDVWITMSDTINNLEQLINNCSVALPNTGTGTYVLAAAAVQIPKKILYH